MKYKDYNRKGKITQIITWCVIALITVSMVVAIIVGAIRNGREDEPVVTEPSAETTTPSGVTEPSSNTDTTNPDISVPIPSDKTEQNNTKPDIDVGEMSRNPEPEVVGGEIEYDTKN